MAIKHSTIATKADEAGAEVNKDEWNEAHTIENGTITSAHLAGTIDATKIHDGSISNTEFGYLNGVTSAIQTQLDSKAATTQKLDDFGATDDNTDLDATTSKHGLMPKADKSKLDGIAAGAEVNPDVVSQAEAEAGTSTTERIWTAQRVAQAISVLDAKSFLDHIRTGSYYGSAMNQAGPSTVQLVADVLRAFPFVVRKGYSIDRIQFEVTTLAAGNCIVGIYSSTAALYPDAKLTNGTAQSTGTTGKKEDTISASLIPDTLYWLVYSCDATPTVRGISMSALPNILGDDGSSLFPNISKHIGWTVARSYDGTLPATFTAGGTLLKANAIPDILVRAA